MIFCKDFFSMSFFLHNFPSQNQLNVTHLYGVMVQRMCGFSNMVTHQMMQSKYSSLLFITSHESQQVSETNKETKALCWTRWGKLWTMNQGSLFFSLLFTLLCPRLHVISVPLASRDSLVEELQSSRVTVVAVDLAVGLVQGGRVGEGGREGVVVRSREGVSWWREERFGIVLRSGKRRRAVVLIGGGGAFSGAQGLSLWQLISQLWYTFLFLLKKKKTKLNEKLGLKILNVFNQIWKPLRKGR